jgi:hypothetical protein
MGGINGKHDEPQPQEDRDQPAVPATDGGCEASVDSIAPRYSIFLRASHGAHGTLLIRFAQQRHPRHHKAPG